MKGLKIRGPGYHFIENSSTVQTMRTLLRNKQVPPVLVELQIDEMRYHLFRIRLRWTILCDDVSRHIAVTEALAGTHMADAPIDITKRPIT